MGEIIGGLRSRAMAEEKSGFQEYVGFIAPCPWHTALGIRLGVHFRRTQGWEALGICVARRGVCAGSALVFGLIKVHRPKYENESAFFILSL